MVSFRSSVVWLHLGPMSPKCLTLGRIPRYQSRYSLFSALDYDQLTSLCSNSSAFPLKIVVSSLRVFTSRSTLRVTTSTAFLTSSLTFASYLEKKSQLGNVAIIFI